MIDNNTFLSNKLEHFSAWKKPRKTALIFALIILAITISMIGYSMIKNRREFVVDKFYFISFSNYFENFSAFFYLTYQSNLLYGFVLLSFIFNPTSRKFQLLFALTVILTIVLLVFWSIIAWNLDMSFIVLLTTSTVHLLHPVLAIIVLFWFRKEFALTKFGLSIAVIYLIIYYLFCLFLYFFTIRQWVTTEFIDNQKSQEENVIYFYTGLTIYPFLNFLHPFFYSGGSYTIVILLNLLMVFSVIVLPYWISLFYINVFGIRSTEWRLIGEIKSLIRRFKAFFWVNKTNK
ncbi:MAGa3780 family membrane protein [Mycoplasma sp. 'Moose RK']|uniref:MAGa3780 family membrane protein n=1 Tax=Mycoplasma sp. 'Moose RK' TaxID=2780095 RepID=UPI0018C31422|nr:hypothetical protein [Mycoplasma sp. 'Moose RK']MBG0730831.1 hypothetical protein [Mycoplasma sp. 'Moose RK']